MKLFLYLQSQGLGSRNLCRQLVELSQVMVNDRLLSSPDAEVIPEEVGRLVVSGREIDTVSLPFFYLLVHKPAGYETSHRPQFYSSVFGLLPDNIRQLNPQAVGRLDADTTGLLLMTNDGQFNHYLCAPKHYVGKVYEVTLKHAADERLVQRLLSGVLLRDESLPCRAVSAFLRTPNLLSLEIQEGKYHQVKRMVAAAGNRVEGLHRTGFGSYVLGALPAGLWCATEKLLDR